tara:strand:- start:195 stop:1703 length:1509 start_codon:yes stop_codon:yes gene_type:complete
VGGGTAYLVSCEGRGVSDDDDSAATTTAAHTVHTSVGATPTTHVEARIDGVHIFKVPHLSETAGPGMAMPNMRAKMSNAMGKAIPYVNYIVDDHDFAMADVKHHVVNVSGETTTIRSRAFQRAGPRREIYFNPSTVRAAVVTCGGLCPGLNNVVRNIVQTLRDQYGVGVIYGIRSGWNGFHNGVLPLMLDHDKVEKIHKDGGSMLGNGRGGFRGHQEKIIEFLTKNNINQLYCVGGDGTHSAALALQEEITRRKLPIAVCGIPKTIDNDCAIIDRSFGFDSAVEIAVQAVQSANVEAESAPNGVGIVKLMGRHAGFIAAHATLASGDVDLCLVPEVPIELNGPRGILPYIFSRVKQNGHALIVVAEGAGEEVLGASAETDGSGHRKLPPIGVFLQKQLAAYAATQATDTPLSVKYVDPSYMIRSVPANAGDAVMCLLLAQNAVHGCMSGFTGFSTGLSNNRVVYIPMKLMVDNSPEQMNPFGRTWERVISSTGQPNSADLSR